MGESYVHKESGTETGGGSYLSAAAIEHGSGRSVKSKEKVNALLRRRFIFKFKNGGDGDHPSAQQEKSAK